MITLNTDLADRLIKGQFGVAFDFAYNDSSITKVYVKLDDQNTGKNVMSKDLYASKYNEFKDQFKELNQKLSSVKILEKHSKELNFH